jgi:hypothetical protein
MHTFPREAHTRHHAHLLSLSPFLFGAFSFWEAKEKAVRSIHAFCSEKDVNKYHPKNSYLF